MNTHTHVESSHIRCNADDKTMFPLQIQPSSYGLPANRTVLANRLTHVLAMFQQRPSAALSYCVASCSVRFSPASSGAQTPCLEQLLTVRSVKCQPACWPSVPCMPIFCTLWNYSAYILWKVSSGWHKNYIKITVMQSN